MKKIIYTITSVLLILSLITGCSKNEVKQTYDNNADINSLQTQVLAENTKFELSWNDDGKFISLRNKATDKKWSSIPYEYFLSGGTSDNVNSPINITVVNPAKAQIDNVSGYKESVSKRDVSVQKINNGLKINYYFDSFSIMIPVSYTLTDDGMNISVNASEIIEGGDKKILSISVAPFLCSAENTADNSYMFIPSGNGGLMYLDERAEGTRKYKAEVYGNDKSRLVPEEIVDNAKIYLPVYGVKSNENALLAIIDKGAESCEIYAEAGNRRSGYSTVYSTFYLRGYDIVETDQWLWGYRDLDRISDQKSNAEFSVNFYPLNNDEADYNGMANKYKEYLFTEQKNTDNTEKAPLYSLNILGGVTYKSASFGIPHKELYTMTTFDEAKDIVKELSDETKTSFAVLMKGFSSTGIDNGKIAGGYKFTKNYGNNKDLSELFSVCRSNEVELSFDFDIVKFSKSSIGFSYIFDAAKSATLRTSDKYGINIPLRSYNDQQYRFLKRDKIDKAVDKLLKFADKKDITAIGLSTLSSMAYSDFDNEKYSIKGNMADQVTDNIKKIKNSGKKVFVSDANSYAAASSDILLTVPDNNGNYFSLDKSIPFYQMVFSGVKPMYSKPLNLSENYDKSLAEAVSTGVRFGFTVTDDFDMVCSSSLTERLYGTNYSYVKEKIVDSVANYISYYESIENAKINSYEYLDDDITKTLFDNDVIVYANHSNTIKETEFGVFEAYEIKIMK